MHTSESRCCNLRLLPTGQYLVQVLFKREQGAFRPWRAGGRGDGAVAVPALEPPRVADLPGVAVQELSLRLEIRGVIMSPRNCVEIINGGLRLQVCFVTVELILEAPLILLCFSFLNLAFD